MKLTIADICSFAKATPTTRNFIEGEKLLNAEHIIFCGRRPQERGYKVIAYCNQTSHMKETPHAIEGDVSEKGAILNMTCSCKAGLSHQCKHIVGVLLHLNRNDLDALEEISCTDTRCVWAEPQKKSLEKYEPKPLRDHECYKDRFKRRDAIKLTEEQKNFIQAELFKLETSALHKHVIGRHAPIEEHNNNLLPEDINSINLIFNHTTSNCVEELHKTDDIPLKECCRKVMDRLQDDPIDICMKTQNSHNTWQKERQYRITGSRCYELYTYSKNKKADWKLKAMKYFYPKPFTNKFVKHGLEHEKYARNAYESARNLKVVQCGLVVSKDNPWIGYSPDGIVFENNTPSKLIEIKCPYAGKTMSVNEVIKTIKWISINENGNITLKKQAYYAQIQFGMGVLNLMSTDLIIYCSFDKSFIALPVQFDCTFACNLFVTLKTVYFCKMIHNICSTENSENCSNNNDA